MRNPFEPIRQPELELIDGPDRGVHETAAVLRMQRQGMSGPAICAALKIGKQQLIHELKLALDDEQEAHRLGHYIHDAGLPEDQTERDNYLRIFGS